MIGRVKHYLRQLTAYLEVIIAVLLSVGVMIGIFDFGEYFTRIFLANASETYDIFQDFLGYALLLIVGIELILMILYHSTSAILELILFVIARKMLIYASSMSELVMGTVAIALVFVVMRFLVNPRVDEFVSRQDANKYSGLTQVRDVIVDSGLNLPIDKGKTLDDLLHTYAEENDLILEEGETYQIGEALINIIDLSPDHKVNKVILEDGDSSR